MNLDKRKRVGVGLGLLAVALLAWGAIAPHAVASVAEQAARIGRQVFTAVTTHAVISVDQHGTGSIADFKDDGTSEFTIDKSSSTTTNPLIINGSSNAYQLSVKAAATQSTPPFVVKNNSGTPVAKIDKDGNITVASVVGGNYTNDLDGGALVIDAGGTTNLRATANYQPAITLGGTPTAAAFSVVDSAGTPAAIIRGAGGIELLKGPIVFGTSVPLAGVASTAVAPVGRLQPVSMATAGTVPITIPPAGQIVCIWNTGSQTVTIADTGNQILTASAALGQYDVLCGLSDGTRFIEISRADN